MKSYSLSLEFDARFWGFFYLRIYLTKMGSVSKSGSKEQKKSRNKKGWVARASSNERDSIGPGVERAKMSRNKKGWASSKSE